MADALRAVQYDAERNRALADDVQDAMAGRRLDEVYGVDGVLLRWKLQGLTPGQALALRDAVERFWIDPRSRALGKSHRTRPTKRGGQVDGN